MAVRIILGQLVGLLKVTAAIMLVMAIIIKVIKFKLIRLVVIELIILTIIAFVIKVIVITIRLQDQARPSIIQVLHSHKLLTLPNHFHQSFRNYHPWHHYSKILKISIHLM